MNIFLDPAILFFVFGIFAGSLKSNLTIPEQITKFLSLYLLMALGLKGGFSLATTSFSPDLILSLVAAIIMAFAVPAIGYMLLKNVTSKFNAAAVAAAYGSVSAVTFVTAMQFLENNGITANGYMSVAMVIMESPAIIMAVLLSNAMRKTNEVQLSLKKVLHESFTDGAHLLLLGSLLVGYLSGEAGKTVMQTFYSDIFKGMLAFFLLDMGLMVARNFKEARKSSGALIAYGLIAPPVHATLALGLALLFGLTLPDAFLLMVLSASASYIVVPAVLRYAIPEANPAMYFGLSIGITFPLNILVGLPAYYYLAGLAL